MMGVGCMISTPCHSGKNLTHQSMSALASRFKYMKWSRLETTVDKSINLLKKMRPGLTTLQAKERSPMSDNNSRLVRFLRTPQVANSCLTSANFSFGSLMVMATVSISMPRNVRQVAGPPVLSVAMGTPSSEQKKKKASKSS